MDEQPVSTALWASDRDMQALRRMTFACRRRQLHQAPHRYAGTVEMTGAELVLRGSDTFTSSPCELRIRLDSLLDVRLGHDRSVPADLVAAPPLRLTFRQEGPPRTVYAFLDWRARTGGTANAGWFALLRERTRAVAST